MSETEQLDLYEVGRSYFCHDHIWGHTLENENVEFLRLTMSICISPEQIFTVISMGEHVVQQSAFGRTSICKLAIVLCKEKLYAINAWHTDRVEKVC